jgi:hypothetical protein
MSARFIILHAVIVAAAVTLGYYLGHEKSLPAVETPSAGSENGIPAEPLVATIPEGPAVPDPVAEHNRKAAELQRSTTGTLKMARLGDEVIALRFSTPPPPALSARRWHDDGRSAGFFDPLARGAAAGDDSAAHELYQSLERCRIMPKTADELRERTARIRDEFARSGGTLPNGETVSLDQAIGNWQRGYERCQGVKPAMYDDAREYLREAADRGNAWLALDYAASLGEGNPEESRKRFESLWAEGHVGALGALGRNSLAHQIAFHAQAIARRDGLPGPNPVLDMLRKGLTKLENETSPSEFQEAEKEAARLLRNPNCCLDP